MWHIKFYFFYNHIICKQVYLGFLFFSSHVFYFFLLFTFLAKILFYWIKRGETKIFALFFTLEDMLSVLLTCRMILALSVIICNLYYFKGCIQVHMIAKEVCAKIFKCWYSIQNMFCGCFFTTQKKAFGASFASFSHCQRN